MCEWFMYNESLNVEWKKNELIVLLVRMIICKLLPPSLPPLSLSLSQIERVVTILQNPRPYKIPDYFLNRQKDIKDGKYSQVRDLF